MSNTAKCKCGSFRIFHIYGKSSDLHTFAFSSPNENIKVEGEGYAPNIPAVCGGDDIELDICMDCGTVQGFQPVASEIIVEEICKYSFHERWRQR